MPVNLQLALDPPLARVRITGDLDLAAQDRLHDRLRDLVRCLRERGCDQVELDLGALTSVDDEALQLLTQERRRLQAGGGCLQVVAASETFLLISDLTGYLELQPSPYGPPRPRLLHGTAGTDPLDTVTRGLLAE